MPSSYRLQCPSCGRASNLVAKPAWFLRGFLLAARYGVRTIVGCTDCVQVALRRECAWNLLAGWWCIPWGIGTPIVLLQNLHAYWTEGSESRLVSVLEASGINPSDVRLDSRGFTGEQVKMLEAAYSVLGRAILADGVVDSREVDIGVRVVVELTDGKLSQEEIVDALLLAGPADIRVGNLPREFRAMLLRATCQVVLADAIISHAEKSYLYAIARLLQFSTHDVERLLEILLGHAGRRPDSTSAPTEIQKALETLQVSDVTDLAAIKAAYRKMMLKYHPDRASRDPAQQAKFHAIAKDLNEAYEILSRYSEAKRRV